MSVRTQVCLLLAVCCCLNVSLTAQANSVYAISRHSDSTVKAFHIDNNGLLGTQYTGQLPNNGSGAIDLAISDRDNLLFSSYDGVNTIEVLSTRTMERIASETISGGTENEIAGLEYCRTYNLLLAAERYDTSIRILEFDPEELKFTRNIEMPMPNVTSGGIVGICLDELEMRLYISKSENSTVVLYYNFDAQGDQIRITYGGEIPIEWNGQSKAAVGIAVYNNGAGKKFLYSSGYNHENPLEHPYLIRTSLTADNQVIDTLGVEVDPFTYVAGVDTDNRTGYLYLTTLIGKSSIRVYDPNQWSSDPNDCQPLQTLTEPDIAGPAGITVGPNFFDPDRLWIEKKQISPDPNTCVDPGTFVTYRTAFHQGFAEESNVVLKESLPEESIFVSADPNTGAYDSATHTYNWDVGDLPALDPNSTADPNMYYEMTVYVTNTAEPGGYIVNTAEVESDSAYAKSKVNTSICCWTTDGLIYVDKKAVGHNSGVDWKNAYRSLKEALDRAGKGCGSEIWVAEGVYSPGNTPSDTYDVPDDVTIYGGFHGTEVNRSQRNWKLHQTVLSGYIDQDGFGNDVQSDTVITMGDNTLLDGFTVKAGGDHGIAGEGADFSVRNCILVDNDQIAIYASDGNLTVQWCQVENSGWHGIFHDAGGSTLEIQNCKIYNNQQDGVYAVNSHVNISNSLIYQNGLASGSEQTYSGIFLENPTTDSILRNNTIVSNTEQGISVTGQNLPLLLNCIVWGNTDNQLGGFDADAAAFYSCIQDCNDVNFNISANPAFAYAALNEGGTNFHLAYNSPCVDAGGGVTDANEFDIDGEMRIFGDTVDIGADEAVACDGQLTEDDIFNPLDHNADGSINYMDFTGLSKAWLCHDPNDPAVITDPNKINDPNYADPATILQWQQHWNPTYNLDNSFTSAHAIDWADLEMFYDQYWLWMACWKENEFLDWYDEP